MAKLTVIFGKQGVHRKCDCCRDTITMRIVVISHNAIPLGRVWMCSKCQTTHKVGWDFHKGKAAFVQKCDVVA